MDIDRAKAVSEVASQIIQSAKVEVDYLRVTGAAEGTGFIEEKKTETRPKPGALGWGGKR